MSLKDSLNAANPNQLCDQLKQIKFGDFIRSQTTRLYKIAPGVPSPLDQIAATHTFKLPVDCKAARILRAYARSGTGTPGELVIDTAPMGAATAAGHISVSAAGDLTFAAADAWTAVDVEYVPEKLDVVTIQLPVVTGDATLPAALTTPGVCMLLRAVLVTGTVTGEGQPIAPGARTATTLQCNLNPAKTKVQFLVADAVSVANLTLAVVPGTDINALLGGGASPYVV